MTLHHFVHPAWFEKLGGFTKEGEQQGSREGRAGRLCCRGERGGGWERGSGGAPGRVSACRAGPALWLPPAPVPVLQILHCLADPVLFGLHLDRPLPASPTLLLCSINTLPPAENIQYFLDYTETAFRLFGDQAKYWATFNEPGASFSLLVS